MTYGGAATSITAWGLDISVIAAVLGALVAVVGLCVQWYFFAQRNARDREYHLARMKQLKGE